MLDKHTQVLTLDATSAALRIEKILDGTPDILDRIDPHAYPIQAIAEALLEAFAEFDDDKNLHIKEWFEQTYQISLGRENTRIEWDQKPKYDFTFKRVDGAPGSLDVLDVTSLEEAIEVFCQDETVSAKSPIGPVIDGEGNTWVMTSYRSAV